MNIVSWFKSFWASIVKWFKSREEKPSPKPAPKPPRPEPDRVRYINVLPRPSRASFLRWNARKPLGRPQGALSHVWSDEEFNKLIEWYRGQGDNTVYVIFADQLDNGCPFSIYLDRGVYVGGRRFDEPAIQRAAHRLDLLARAGFAIVGFLTADDSPAIYRAGREALVEHAKDVYEIFDYALCAYCTGIEIDEDGRGPHARSIVNELKRLTQKPIFAHYRRGDWSRAKAEGYDGIMWQYGFNRSYKSIFNETRDALVKMKRHWRNGLFIACEYDKNSNCGIGPRLLQEPELRAIGVKIDGYGNKSHGG